MPGRLVDDLLRAANSPAFDWQAFERLNCAICTEPWLLDESPSEYVAIVLDALERAPARG